MSSDEDQHLKQGDPEPATIPEKFTLYEAECCPYCQRVRYTLDYHQIPYDRILINLSAKPGWYLRLYPAGKVPLLLYRTEQVTDSDLIMKYVDQFKGDESSLLSVCGEEGFKMALDLSSAIALPRYKICFTTDATKDDVDALKDALSNLDKAIKGPYLMGENMSLGDPALFPFLNAWDFVMGRLMKLDDASGDSIEAVASHWPNVLQYRKLMNQQPFITMNAFQDEDFAKFVDEHIAANS
nr:unnamed protein product [Spirometra erinaceieuropaei]